jgi:hypothetical protein
MRIEDQRWPEDDELRQQVREAYEAMNRVRMILHYMSCQGADEVARRMMLSTYSTEGYFRRNSLWQNPCGERIKKKPALRRTRERTRAEQAQRGSGTICGEYTAK